MSAHHYYVATTALGLALDSLRSHKLRSFLTLLGIIIGVASVIVIGSAIEGLGVFARDNTARVFGTESYLIGQVVSVGRIDRKVLAEKMRRNKRFREEEIRHLRAVTGRQIVYSPYRQTFDDVKRASLIYEGASILGVSSTLPEIREVALAEGRFFTESEERSSQRLAIIGQEIAASLFPGKPAVGGTVKLRGLDFRVIGIQEKLGSFGPQTQDNSFFIPAASFSRLYGRGNTLAVFGRARPESGLSLEESLDLTRAALRSRFKTKPGEADNFDILTPDAIRGFVDNILGVIRAVVVPITLISLIVGGIVIMNIMLVSVTERTQEIGIRKSLGARRGDILLQFLIEAVLLAIVGGTIGLVFGALISRALAGILDLRLHVSPAYVLLALFASSTVGIVSGWYPARRAARLDPVEALRAE